MTSASKELYKATKRQLYFKDITIVLPRSWATQWRRVSGPQFDMSHIVVGLRSIASAEGRPFVSGMTECGVQAQHINVPNQALLFEVDRKRLGKTYCFIA